jgi:hypothetical protein
MVLETVRQCEPMVRTLAREGIALSLRIDPISLRVWYCGDDEEEEEEEEKKREEEEEEEEDDDEEEEDEEWKVSRPGKGALCSGRSGCKLRPRPSQSIALAKEEN